MIKTVATITGIRPDFIRMSSIFKKLDESFKHILIHTGQHYDTMLSDVFFNELEIRTPDHNLAIGGSGKPHYKQLGELSTKVMELLEAIERPDIILFLGDSNSVLASVPLRKEGYAIGHIEGGMRSHDKRMLEETNRIVCDHCSDYIFAYHDNYKANCSKEGIGDRAYVVGNTIVEVCKPFADELKKQPKRKDCIVLDIHRPENFNDRNRLANIISYAQEMSKIHALPVEMLTFGRTIAKLNEYGLKLGTIVPVNLLSYKDYLAKQYHASFLISDSGTAQEEPALLDTPVIVPRDFTERIESVRHGCSYMINVNKNFDQSWFDSCVYLERCYLSSFSRVKIDPSWLGDGTTATRIVEILKSI